MKDRKDCAHYADCYYRKRFGYCAYWCMKYKQEGK